MINENWKPVKGYEGLYEVSDLGNVRSLNYKKTGDVRLMHPAKNKDGYLHLGLRKDGEYRQYGVHRIVAEAFIPNPDNLPQVNHKDENPLNNNVSNLEWCTCMYNNNYGKHSKYVVQYTKDGVLLKVHKGISVASRETNVDFRNISDCCRGKQKSAGGYIWRYQ